MKLPGFSCTTAIAFALAMAFTGHARAQDFFTSSPGKLSQSHASIDGTNQCNECHDGGKAVSTAKCLGCHDHQDLKQRIDAGKGFHASARVKGRPCSDCHKEHRGRGFDLMGWQSIGGQNTFDHNLAGWPLRAKHAVIECKNCHPKANRQGLRLFLGQDKTCGSCHEKDQPHGDLRSSLMDCARCHSEAAWKPPLSSMRFDHDKKSDAAMPLVGTHGDVSCAKCHPKAKFKLGPKADQCETCHQSPHEKHLFGTKSCEWCHSPTLRSLKSVRFQHKQRTGYPLLGKHGTIDCYRCHTSKLGKKKPEALCQNCHADDNHHGNRFQELGSPLNCNTCHSQQSWKSGHVFNHGQQTKFELTGVHQKARCRDCHRGSKPSQFERFDLEKDGCMGCHKHKSAHGGKYRNDECLGCHIEPGNTGMRKESLEKFHGEKSRFPLTERHAQVKCDLCHINDIYKNTPSECGARCHEDSLHRGSLGDQCSRCHAPGLWEASRFDHRQDTKFPLLGKHQQKSIKCEDCHPGQHFADTPKNCSAGQCHKKDDVHQGALGDACERCHNETGALLFEHNRDSEFKIDGAHTLALCASCHKNVLFKPTRRDCVGCHPEPAVHKGMYGTACQNCHSTKSFGDIGAMHDVGDFSLRGAHDSLDCRRCHARGEKRKGSGDLCITCHKQDDIHSNGLSPRCGQCHTQISFAPARFDHISVGCNLSGLHRTLPCVDCHKNGNFSALSAQCVGCHRDTALAVESPPHDALFECGECHNTNAWSPMGRFGRQTICR